MPNRRIQAAVFLIGMLSLLGRGESGDVSPRYSVSLGPGYGYWIKGLIDWPVEWRSSSPVVVMSVHKSTERFTHGARIEFGRSGSINAAGQRRPGENGFLWLPVEYSFTWHCARDIFRIKRLDWGFGGTAQFLRLSETIDLQEGQSAQHWEQYIGLGPNMAFRWRSGNLRWTGLMTVSITCVLPYLSRAGVISDAIPEQSGGLWWLRSDLSISVERALSESWILTLGYERDAVIAARTTAYKLRTGEIIGGANYLLSQISMKIGYRW